MPFALEITSVREVHRNLGTESYRHWTILIGVLCSGVVQLRNYISIPSLAEKPFVSKIIGLEPNINNVSAGEKLLMLPSRAFAEDTPDFIQRRGELWLNQSSIKQIEASEVTQPLMIVTWGPAYDAADIQLGTVANECSQELYTHSILELLQQEPQRILHCRDCAAELSNMPLSMPYLKELIMHPNRELVKRAVGIYNYLYWQQRNQI
jgi:hypothetical protein